LLTQKNNGQKLALKNDGQGTERQPNKGSSPWPPWNVGCTIQFEAA